MDALIKEWQEEMIATYVYSKILTGEYEPAAIEIAECAEFRDYTPEELPVCYDVEAYRAEQKAASQGGMLLGSVFGDFLGSMATDDLEKSSQDTQENRISFYTKLEGSLEDSYYQLCVAKSAFDELYDMESIELEEGLEAGSFNDADAVYLALQDYMTALRRYADDLNNAKMFWDISLSDKEDAFVDGVQKQLQNAYNVVNAGINIGILSDPYDDAEEQARYVSLMDDYIEFLNLSMIYSTSESTFSHVSNVTAYGGEILKYIIKE